ncbi:hypothetical protein [Pseudomonas synxantha]|uniref:hypothetical protein n=1 Tax=Pseudomonas synxantha TaxID=47883 RepID=UPI00278E6FA0|nr:hypothetical protein [Pseudomonas synxantha]MDQ0982534.1 hypothetical protein [Pseudomonas synxantha]
MKYEKTLITLCRQPKLTLDLIVAAFNKHENKDVDVSAKNLDRPGFEIATDEGLCFVTERPISYYNEKWGRVTGTQELALPLSLPVPLHIVSESQFINELFAMRNSKNPRDAADYWLNEYFAPEIAATYFNKYFSVSNSLSEYRTIVFEAIEAYYLGMDHIAIMSLIPVFEAGLRNIQDSKLSIKPNNVSTDVFERNLKDIIKKWGSRQLEAYAWYPGKDYNSAIEIDFLTHICPQSDVMNAFRIFFKDVLYKSSTGNNDGFNRHLIIHLLKNDFKNPANFVRIFICLTHIVFIESLENTNVPFSWPGIDAKDRRVAEYFIEISEKLGSPRRPILQSLGIDGYETP